MELKGERVTLRPIRDDEVDELYRQRLASEHLHQTPDKELLRRRIEHSGAWFEGRIDVGIEAEGRLAGSLDARSSDRVYPPGVCEIGIELTADMRGAGLGGEAIELFADWLLDNGFERVQASTEVTNRPMRRVFEKLGWEHEGTLRHFMPSRDGRADYALYAITQRSRPRRAP
jgi:RimJ/RimL family protein N-acetyltransferase